MCGYSADSFRNADGIRTKKVGSSTVEYVLDGTKVVTYNYDAWGNLISSSFASGYSTLPDLNPFRYRGYYYDIETGFYYLQSRYYDPATGRFLNADIHINANGDLQGFNMYAYCSNNPIMYVDYTGEMGIAIAGKALASAGKAGLIVLGVLVVVAVGIVVYSCSTDGSVTEDELRNLMGR